MSKKNKHSEENEDFQGDYNINADDSISGSEYLTDPIEAEAAIEKFKMEAEEAKDKYLRLAAEFDNFRKRTMKERSEFIQVAGRDIIANLLDVLDDADRAEKQIADGADLEIQKEGIALVFNKLRNVLQAKGLKTMEAIGHDFDPDLHEAITEIPAPTNDLKGKIVDEISKGYYLNDKIIRHAKVVVGK